MRNSQLLQFWRPVNVDTFVLRLLSVKTSECSLDIRIYIIIKVCQSCLKETDIAR
jgi:hypothetical protein